MPHPPMEDVERRLTVATTKLSAVEDALFEAVRRRLGLTRAEYLREALMAQLERDGAAITDTARRAAPRRQRQEDSRPGADGK